MTDAEREQAARVLRRHFDDGRLDSDDFAERVQRVFTAATLAEVDAVLADLPLLASGAVGSSGGRRHGEKGRALPGWRPTSERFRDPSTGRVMRVWVDPADGTRHYVPD